MASTPLTNPRDCWRRWLLLGCLLCGSACAQGAVRVQVKTLAMPGVELANVVASIALGTDGKPQLKLQAAAVTVPALGWRNVALELEGTPQRTRGGAWDLAGHAVTRGAPGGALSDAKVEVSYDPNAATLEVTLTQGRSRLHVLMPLDQTSHLQLNLAELPLAWLRGALAAMWPAGRLQAGTVSGNVALDLADKGSRLSGRVALHALGLDTKAGDIAAQKLGLAGSFRATGGAVSQVMFDGTLDGGQLLLGPLYAVLPGHAANLHLAATFGAAGVAIDSLDYDDHDALRIAGKLGFDRDGHLDDLDLERFAATFPAAYARYGTTLVQGLTGLKQLTLAGSVVGSMVIHAGRLRQVDLRAEDVSLRDADSVAAVAGLNGQVDWRAGASRPATTLAWNALSLYRLDFGPARLDLVDRAGTLALAKPVTVGLLGGAVQLSRLAWRPDAGGAARLAAAFALTDVDLPSLCKAFGWPTFGGKLGGAVPDLSYRNGALVFGGGLSLNVFDGAVSVTDLSLRHPFGNQPVLAADIDMQRLELGQLTSAFDFGRITGLLDGHIRGLRLVDWKPVAFDAALHADGGGRISQDAIKSLTEVGGGGIAGGLQGMALRLFKTFAYARIGLTCKLAGGVCTMGGITPDAKAADGSYTIVEGSGLPHITVIGHERAVDWATLIGRLQAATHGSGPVVR